MAQYPGAAGTDANLFVAVNNLSTTLNGALTSSGDNTSGSGIAVASTAGFPTAGYITIDTEAISYTGISGNNFTGITRGADGTTAASHTNGVQVFHDAVADHHNTLKEEVKAVEGDLVSAFGAITPAGPNATDTSMLNRIKSIAAQLKAIAGTTNWYDAISVALTNVLDLAGSRAMTGALNMGSHKITSLTDGSAASDAASFGQIYYGFQAPVQSSGALSFTTTSSTFQNTGRSATITPTSSSHRIKITVTGTLLVNNAPGVSALLNLARGATDLSSGAGGWNQLRADATGEGLQRCAASICYIDSPATTSATTYNVQLANTDNSSTVGFGNGLIATIILEEIV